MASQWYNATVQTAVDSIGHTGGLLNSGFIKIYSGSAPAVNGALTGTLLATMTLNAVAFAASTASGVTVTATAGTITAGTAVATNTAGYFALVKSDGTTVVATGSVGTSGADLNFNSLSIQSGASVSCTGFSLTMPQTGS